MTDQFSQWFGTNVGLATILRTSLTILAAVIVIFVVNRLLKVWLKGVEARLHLRGYNRDIVPYRSDDDPGDLGCRAWGGLGSFDERGRVGRRRLLGDMGHGE